MVGICEFMHWICVKEKTLKAGRLKNRKKKAIYGKVGQRRTLVKNLGYTEKHGISVFFFFQIKHIPNYAHRG